MKRGQVGNSAIEVGRFTYGYETMEVYQWGEGASLEIGAFCSISNGLKIILGGNHRTDWSTTFPFGHIFIEELGGKGIQGHPQTRGNIRIGNDVWIGRNVTILSGVCIENGAVIAANSTVTRDIGAYEIWGGNPANFIKNRFEERVKDKLLSISWWSQDIEIINAIAHLLSQPPTYEILSEVSDMIQEYNALSIRSNAKK